MKVEDHEAEAQVGIVVDFHAHVHAAIVVEIHFYKIVTQLSINCYRVEQFFNL